MKILFISYKKNSLTGERELYEQDLMIDVLGFDRSLLDLGLLTILARTMGTCAAQNNKEPDLPVSARREAFPLRCKSKLRKRTNTNSAHMDVESLGKRAPSITIP